MHRGVGGSLIGVASAMALGGVMFPVRSHLSIATTGLVLVVPVVAGVITGGYPAGIVTVAAGFLTYDFAFIPPYYTLTVGAAQNWVVLGVYVVVMLLVAQVVSHLQIAQIETRRRAAEAQRLFELSELLVGEHSVNQLLETIVGVVRTVFDVEGVALLLPDGDDLSVAAQAGAPISDDALDRLRPDSGVPVGIGTSPGRRGEVRAVALSASGRPIGILALQGLPESEADRALLHTFANHAALALERAQLRAQALRSELLEQSDRLRRDLLGAVSHDLRTPLATMKVASSTLLDPDSHLTESDTRELHGLLDVQTERLSRLVGSLLDMTRIQAGALRVHPTPFAVIDLVGEALASIRPSIGERVVEVNLPESLPSVVVDPLLINQVLVNLLDNADRHGPDGTSVRVAAEQADGSIHLSVSDCGPGVPRQEREAIFESFVRFDTGGRSGLGLAIAKSFVEAHGQRIWVEEGAGAGARFTFTMPVSKPTPVDR